jgi:tetratricopeptide (TPR) repeat protein
MEPVTIETAYAWLNTNEGHALRPPLRKYYLAAIDAKAEMSRAIEQNRPSADFALIAEKIGSEFEALKKAKPVFISDAFSKAAGQLAKVIGEKNHKEVENLCQQIGSAGGSHLAASTSDLVLRISNGSAANLQYSWQTIKLIENISHKLSDNMEAAEALAECGYAAYHLGNAEDAVRYFRQAIKKYNTPRHQIAMTEWMLGWVQWHTPGSRDQGFVALRDSIDKFDFLGEHPAFGREGVGWYRDRCKEMRDTLEWLIQSGVSSMPASSVATPVPAATLSVAAPIAPTPAPTPTPTTITTVAPPPIAAVTVSAMPNYQDILRLFDVTENIPAGGFEPTAVNGGAVIGHVDIPLVLINDEWFRVQDLRKAGKLIDVLASGHKYTVVRVTGDSMNKDGIDIGDYVLLRQQEDATNNDIVAAEIVGVDTEATLKRFLRRNGEVTLRPNSTNPQHKDHVFKKINTGLYVRGVAYAVFKPVKLS